ncbi:MAG: 4-hydroxy-3-methylbut-2-enyl diphosphate reductase, partial [Candidatus Omnitrophota bacterium]
MKARRLKINLAKSAGFCFGVKRAIDIAYKTISGNKDVYVLGNIVHNEEVAGKLKEAGLKKARLLTCGKGRIFLIRAHGASLEIINKAKNLGYKIVDATCPMVKEIHKIGRSAESRGYAIIVIGDKKHDEVQGIIGNLKKRAILIENIRNIPWLKLKGLKKACVISQSTQNLDNVLKIIEALKPRLKELQFFNTICQPTRIKQQEMKRMPRENEVMIIIGSRTSANTKRLYEISKSLNKRSYWVES